MRGSTNAMSQMGVMCTGKIATGQTLNTAWTTKILTYTDFVGNNEYFTNDSNAGVIINKTGTYLVIFRLTVNTGASGLRVIPTILSNAAAFQMSHSNTGGGDYSTNTSAIVTLTKGDRITFGMNGDSTNFSTTTWSNFYISYLGGGA